MKLEYYMGLCDRSYRFKTFDSQTIQGYTEEQNNTLSIVFSSSNQDIDWKNHLLFFKKRIPYEGTNKRIKVHAGFINEYSQEAIRDYLLGKVKKFIENNPSGLVEVVGHSYGAALAILCALDIQYHYNNVRLNCVALSAPRVGNRHFEDSFNKRVINYKMIYKGSDLVTALPPSLFGYKQVRKTIHLGKRKIWLTITNTVKYTLMFLFKKVSNYYNFYIFQDHDYAFFDKETEIDFIS